MKGASVLRPRRQASRLASGGVAVLALLVALSASVWHQRPAVAHPSLAAPGVPVGTAGDPSVPQASLVFANGATVEGQIVNPPTF